jgi:hypothetical protein
MDAKKEAAEKLIEWHFEIEPDTVEIYRFFSADEDSVDEPIKLLEVNKNVFETGRVDVFGFGPSGDIPCSTMTATVTGSEMEKIQLGEIPLPKGWDLAKAEKYTPRRKRHAA